MTYHRLKPSLPLIGLGGRKAEITHHSPSVNSRKLINRISNRGLEYSETLQMI
jgi:hypothetical protein